MGQSNKIGEAGESTLEVFGEGKGVRCNNPARLES